MELPANATKTETLQFIVSGGKFTEKPKVRESFILEAITEEYLETRTASKEPSTIKGEKIHIGHFKRLLGPSTEFEKIDGGLMQKYASYRMKENGQKGKTLSPATVKKEFRTFDQIWRMAIRKGIVRGISPTKEVDLALSEEPAAFLPWSEIEATIKRGNLTETEISELWRRLFLDEKQTVELLTFIAEKEVPFLHAAVAMAAYTGARRSEIMRSLIEDWDFQQMVVKIREKKGSRKHKLSFRNVEMHPALEKIARGWIEVHPGGRHFIVVPWEAFTSRKKISQPIPMSVDDARSFFENTLKDSKWKVLNGWHVLRHSFCSNCARRGVPDRIIDEWMGHRGDEAVKKRYRHLFPSDKRKFMHRLFIENSEKEAFDESASAA